MIGKGGVVGGKYLFFDVLERAGTDHGETHQEYIGLRVGQGPQAIVILLT